MQALNIQITNMSLSCGAGWDGLIFPSVTYIKLHNFKVTWLG